MDNQDSDFDKIEETAAERRRQVSFDDLQMELSGVDVGRIGRFLSSDAREKLLAQKQGRPTKAMSALEAALMNSPAFATAYTFAKDETGKAQREVQAFQDEVDAALTQMNTDIKHTLDNAVTLPSGDKAFMDRKGHAWTASGARVDEAIAAGIDWTNTLPHEDYVLKLEQQEKLEGFAYRGRVMADTVGGNLHELQDEDGSSTPDELNAIGEEAQGLALEAEELRQEVRMLLKPSNTAAPQVSTISMDAVPTL